MAARCAIYKGCAGGHNRQMRVIPNMLWTGILRPARPASLRALPAARGDRAPHDQGSSTPVQRHRRALPPHRARRTLPRRRPQDLVRDDRGNAGRPRRLARHLQYQTPPPGPQHGRSDTASGLHRRAEKRARTATAKNKRRDADNSAEKGFNTTRNPRRLNPLQKRHCQVITVSVQVSFPAFHIQ